MSHSLDKQSKDELEYDSWKERGAQDFDTVSYITEDAVRRIPDLIPQPSTPPRAPQRLEMGTGWFIAWITAYIVIPVVAYFIGQGRG